MLPFCKRGYTLALDIPHRGQETLRRLDDLDRIVLDYGGRVYLTKDARMSREAFREMYPEWREWIDIVRHYNPEGNGRSLMSERFGAMGIKQCSNGVQMRAAFTPHYCPMGGIILLTVSLLSERRRL